jgi:multicomponent Na+:H+ antiporter subunit D
VTWYHWLPVLMIASSAGPAVAIFFLEEESHGWRTLWNMLGAVVKILLLGVLFYEVHLGRTIAFHVPLLPGLTFKLHADALSLLFAGLSTGLWFLTTIYAIGYLEHSPHRSRFFGFFSLCVSTTIGIAMAGNLITLLIFYEFLSLTTWPLVVHRGNRTSITAGHRYLVYTLGGGALLLIGVVWLQTLVGEIDFVARGGLAALPPETHADLRLIFAMLVLGFGVKAALVPLHGWLPHAMVAPAPVSALLHAVAVVKAGAFGIVRVVYDIFGIEFCERLGVLEPLAGLAAFTILFGSWRALAQDDLKRRLAYSTVSQVSYIVLGAAVFGPKATIGGIVHLVHQGLMKITLFFCAGNFAEELGLHRVSELDGVGRRMPWTMVAFTVGALGMIGVPPIAGFVSKWYLGWGALEAGMPWVIAVLALSSLLNAAYFLPILYAGWFGQRTTPWPAPQGHVPDGIVAPGPASHRSADSPCPRWLSVAAGETSLLLLAPALATAALSLLAGILAGSSFSPLYWARFIMMGEY